MVVLLLLGLIVNLITTVHFYIEEMISHATHSDIFGRVRVILVYWGLILLRYLPLLGNSGTRNFLVNFVQVKLFYRFSHFSVTLRHLRILFNRLHYILQVKLIICFDD